MTDEEFVKWAKEHDMPRPKFYKPERAEFFKKTIEDLRRLMPWARI